MNTIHPTGSIARSYTRHLVALLLLLATARQAPAQGFEDWPEVYARPIGQTDPRHWSVISGDWTLDPQALRKHGEDNEGILLFRLPVVAPRIRIELTAASGELAGDLSLYFGVVPGDPLENGAFIGFGTRGNRANILRAAGQEIARSETPLIAPRRSHRIAVTRDGGRLRLDVDGVLAAEGAEPDAGLPGRFLALYAWHEGTFSHLRVLAPPDAADALRADSSAAENDLAGAPAQNPPRLLESSIDAPGEDAPTAMPAAPWPPLADDALVFVARPGKDTDLMACDPAGKPGAATPMTRRGLARLDRGGMALVRDGFLAASIEPSLTARVRDAQAAGIELWFRPETCEPTGNGAVLVLGPQANPACALRQRNGRLVLTGAASGARDICSLGDGLLHQVVLAWEGGSLHWHVNGRHAGTTRTNPDLARWTDGSLTLGALPDGTEDWPGAIAALVFRPCSVGPDDVRASLEAFPTPQAPPAPLQLRAKLLRSALTPDIEHIAPYTRTLAVFEYAVEELLGGGTAPERIAVAHWTILDRERLPIADLAPGRSYDLALAPFLDQPQLAQECTQELDEVDVNVPLYYDLAAPSRAAPESVLSVDEVQRGTRVNGFATFVEGKNFSKQAYFTTRRAENTEAIYILSASDNALARTRRWIAWDSAVVPEHADERVTFALEVVLAGYYNNDGYVAKFAGIPGPFPFELSLDGKPLLRLDTVLRADTGWSRGPRKDPDHVRAFFDYLCLDKFCDVNGILYVNVPRSRVQAGRPARWRIDALPAPEEAFLGIVPAGTDTWQFAQTLRENPAAATPDAKVIDIVGATEDRRRLGNRVRSLTGVADDILALTGGAHARITWVRNATMRSNRQDDGTTGEYILMGFGTREGKEHVILPGPASFGRPFLTADGKHVIFTDFLAPKIHLVDWDGGGERILADGYAHCGWRDPATGIQWIYFTPPVDDLATRGFTSIRRFPLSDPSADEWVWDKIPLSARLSLSADGRRASGEFPWPECGILQIPEQTFLRLGKGCNPAISPDTAYRTFFMDGEHHGLHLYDGDGAAIATVPVNTMAGVDGGAVWYARWSSHPDVITINGPGEGSNLSNIYIGRFSPDYKSIAQWVQVTADASHETAANAWIEP